MKVTEKEYAKMAERVSPNSNVLKDCLWAFCVGGAICTLGQFIKNMFISMEFSVKDASTFVSILLIILSAAATAVGVYDNLAKHAGAGTIVPITGFANSIVSPAMEFKSEGYVIGIGGKMFVIAGPVLVYGTCASVLYGLIIFLFKLY